MKIWFTSALAIFQMLVLLFGYPSTAPAAIADGSELTDALWAKAVLEVPGAPVTLVWNMVGADITPSGDQVISGYFYADPDDFAYGSIYNPEMFVKIYIAANGWANIAFNHVTVDPITVYSAHQYTGTPMQTHTATLTNRLVEHQYSGVAIDPALQSDGSVSGSSSGAGYIIGPELWGKAILQPSTGPVNLIWKQVGSDTTPSGDSVISGYFYASPDDFAYGSIFNPEVFVKIYIASNGWTNIAFNHVSVDAVDISSSADFSGIADRSGMITIQNRLGEHTYDPMAVPSENCSQVSGGWTEDVQGTITATAQGMSQSDDIHSIRTIVANQNGCDVALNYDDSGIPYTRYATIAGNTLHISGPGFGDAKNSDIVDLLLGGSLPGATITFTEDQFTAQGTILSNSITIHGSGVLNGSVTYRGVTVDFKANYTENSVLTPSANRFFVSSEVQPLGNLETRSAHAVVGLFSHSIRNLLDGEP